MFLVCEPLIPIHQKPQKCGAVFHHHVGSGAPGKVLIILIGRASGNQQGR